ncbi:hypothetical protein KIN12_01155, partial [Vibrio cholerae]|nr:hypothetical protein [Vibrio cholerae]
MVTQVVCILRANAGAGSYPLTGTSPIQSRPRSMQRKSSAAVGQTGSVEQCWQETHWWPQYHSPSRVQISLSVLQKSP